MKANPILLLDIKCEDVFRIRLTNILWMHILWNTSHVSGDVGFAFRTVLLCEGNMNGMSCRKQSAKCGNVSRYVSEYCGEAHVSIVTYVGGEMQEERKIYLRAVGDGNESRPPEHHLIDSEKDVR